MLLIDILSLQKEKGEKERNVLLIDRLFYRL